MGNRKKNGFIKLPRALLLDKSYQCISVEAKVLYALMLDRVGVSAMNGLKDKQGKVYIYCKIEEIQKVIGCGHDKACKILAELSGVGLITRVKQGQGKATRIYVTQQFWNLEVQTSEKSMAEHMESRSPDFGKSEANYTKHSQTDSSYTHLSIEEDWMECRKELWEAMECEELCENYPRESVCALTDLVVEMLCSVRPMVRIGKDDYPIRAVKDRFLLLNREHIAYVLDELGRTKSEIRNVKGYILVMLFNAPTTIDAYYQTQLQRDYPNSCTSDF